MITGYNANIRHGDRVFHVQTEDSGRAHPHVITLLYFEGTILASKRSDYSAIVDAPDLASQVRQLMESQHAAVVELLRLGEFDAVIEARLGGPATPAALPPKPQRAAARPRASRATVGSSDLPRATVGSSDLPRATVGSSDLPRATVASGDPPRAFGDGIVSERPLDDVILEYLVAKSRERARGGRGSQSDG
jgi:hypothetical protein